MSDFLREVAFIDEWDGLHVLHIAADAVPAARDRGWMVWDDFEATFNPPRLVIPQPDGDIGETR